MHLHERRGSWQRSGLVAMMACLVLGGPAGAAPPAQQAGRATNRLAQESSPYLLQHAHNPVDWHPWGPEAFARAKREGKLVFLSIGYSSCHWCHVMERESFAKADIAKLMNDGFVCIKVDREERPDVDHIYMTALHVLGQRGGWPLSMFLTADGRPLLGGTYWPPEDREIQGEKVHGFKSILRIVQTWANQSPKEVEEQAAKLASATQQALVGVARGIALVDLNRELVAAAVAELKGEFDPVHGGFGSAGRSFRGTKFPTPPYLSLLLYEAARTKTTDALNMATLTLDRMALGGIYDQLGGGFHRYSTERTWTVPHFEKMLYDNAQLAEVYAAAYRLTKKPLYRRVLQETLGYVSREMTGPQGGFYSALDADSEEEEGRFYVWTPAELAAALPDPADLALVKKVYGADKEPNFENKYHILTLPRPLAEVATEMKLGEDALVARLTPLRQRLFEVRARRPRPFLDTKVLTSWNGQMIAGFAAAGAALEEPRYVETAARAADFVLAHLRTPEGRLLRTYSARPGTDASGRLNGYLDDYAFFVHGLLALHDATGTPRWLEETRKLTDTMIQQHADTERGGFFYTSNDHEKLFARAKDQYDGAQPSGNSVAARNLVRLWQKTGDTRYRDLAERSLKTFAAGLKTSPTSMTTMVESLALFLDAREAPAAKAAPPANLLAQGGAKRSDSVVKVTAKADKPNADGQQTVTVTLVMDKTWHVYANPVGLEDLAGAQTTVTVTGKIKPQSVEVVYPKAKEINDPVVGKYNVYEDQATIKATVRRAPGDTGPLEVSVKFQACNDKTCLLPATVKVSIP